MRTLLKKIIPPAWHYRLALLKRSVLGYQKYAQFGEDAVVLELFKDKKEGRYVDVGAHHPYRYSNTYLLYKKGWRGVNIDPNPETIRLFKNARPDDENICCGAGSEAVLTYYRFSDPAVNTFVESEALKWKQKSFLTFLGTTDVPVKPLSVLVHGPVDLLTIDAEGMDLEVLRSYDWKESPRVVVVEGEDSAGFLNGKGYVLHAKRGASSIFVRGKNTT